MDPQRSRNVGREVILTDEGWPGEVAQVKGFHLRGRDVSIGQALLAGCDSKRTKVAVGERAEGRLADADDSYRSHAFSVTQPGGLLMGAFRGGSEVRMHRPSITEPGTPRLCIRKLTVS